MSDEFNALMTNSQGRWKAPLEFAMAVAELTEAERRRFSKAAQKQMSGSRAGERENFGWPTVEGHMARLALLACAPKSAACRRMEFQQLPRVLTNPSWFSPPSSRLPGPNAFEEAALKILTDRRPDWADDWLELQLTEEGAPALSVPLIRKLIQDGVCSKPESAGYARLISMLGHGADVENDPELLEDAWLLFQVPTGVFEFITHIKLTEAESWKEKHPESWWPRHFYYLAYHGKIDRAKLLDELLAGLWREFPSHERGGLMHFHHLLAPADQELLARQDTYIELLRNPNPPVVTFALQILKRLARSDHFVAESCLRALPAVFDIPTKTQAKSALTVLKTLVRKRPDLKPVAVDILVRGLSHPESEVQIALLGLLETWSPDELPSDALLSFRELISPLAQPRFEELVAKWNPEAAATFIPNAEPSAKALDISELRARIAALPSEWRTTWKLDQSLAACEAGRPPVPTDPDVAAGWLAGLAEVTPIRNVEELIDTIGEALERMASPMEIERILDGLSRLGRQRPADFQLRTGAIRQRLLQLADPVRSQGMLDQNSLLFARFHIGALLRLLGIWL
ncbi:MAG: hypothetical protein EA424_29515, partial [Planctomycetaceae bacterium]